MLPANQLVACYCQFIHNNKLGIVLLTLCRMKRENKLLLLNSNVCFICLWTTDLPDPFIRKNTFFSCFSVFISLYFTLFLSVLGLFQFLSVMAIPRNWRCSKTPVFSQYFQTWDPRFTSCYCSKPVLHQFIPEKAVLRPQPSFWTASGETSSAEIL